MSDDIENLVEYLDNMEKSMKSFTQKSKSDVVVDFKKFKPSGTKSLIKIDNSQADEKSGQIIAGKEENVTDVNPKILVKKRNSAQPGNVGMITEKTETEDLESKAPLTSDEKALLEQKKEKHALLVEIEDLESKGTLTNNEKVLLEQKKEKHVLLVKIEDLESKATLTLLKALLEQKMATKKYSGLAVEFKNTVDKFNAKMTLVNKALESNLEINRETVQKCKNKLENIKRQKRLLKEENRKLKKQRN